MLDTASANTWVGNKSPYLPGPNSQDTGETVQVIYGSESFSGQEFTDDVTVDSLTIQGQSIGVKRSSSGLHDKDCDGILGLGPIGLSQGTTSGGGEIPTIIDNLYSQGIIAEPLVAISLTPSTGGELTYGATDASQFTGDITYTPITSTIPANNFWGIDAEFTYGSQGTHVLSQTAGIVDYSTTRLLLATDGFHKFQQVTGATLDPTTGFLTLSTAQFNSLESLFLHIGGTTFEITANALIWPRSLNRVINGKADGIYLVVGDLGSPSGKGHDFTIGYSILKRLYIVLDTGNSQVGVATTPHTFDTTN
ncbi:hypothetical protein BGZ68_008640 [Mortierella alpina]|nr:hypothetical protein BGZ68_008640 [Mortierella alpina]